MKKLNLWNSKSGRVSLDYDTESKAFEINSWKFQTWEEEKTDRSQEFEGSISQVVDDEIKEAEKELQYYKDELIKGAEKILQYYKDILIKEAVKKLQYYKDELNNDYPVFYYENTDKIG